MREKMKSLVNWIQPHIALLMVVVLVLSLLPIGDMMRVDATTADVVGTRTSWCEREGVKDKVFEFKSVPETMTSYTAYEKDANGVYQPVTVNIDRNATLGTKTNPYAISSPEDLILFGNTVNICSGGVFTFDFQDNTKDKFFILTEEEYDMEGDSYYMTPLFPSSTYSASSGSGFGMKEVENYFSGTLIGNNAVITNAYIANAGPEDQFYMLGLFNGINGASIYDLSITNATYTGDLFQYMGGIAATVKGGTATLINCNVDATVDFSSYNGTNFQTASGLTTLNAGSCTAQDCEVSYNIATGSKSMNFNSFVGKGGTITDCIANIEFGDTTLTMKDSLTVNLSNEENIFGTITSTGQSIWFNQQEVTVPSGATVLLNEDGSLSFDNVPEGETVTMNGNAVDSTKNYCSVMINPNYADSQITSDWIAEGTNMEKPDGVLRSGYRLDGWSTDVSSTEMCTFPYEITESVTFYAVWSELNYEASDLSAVKDITSTNVTLADKTVLEKAKSVLNTYYGDGTGLADSDKNILRSKIDGIDELLNVISKVESVKKSINELPDVVTAENEEAVSAAQDAYNALSDYEKSMIDSTTQQKLNDKVTALNEFKTGGNNSSEEISLPEKGKTYTDDSNSAKYMVTVLDATNKTVQYVKPVEKKSKVTIPATVIIDGVTFKVTGIAKNAFKGDKKVTQVTIGENVETIGTNAFYGCNKLKNVTIGKNVTTINNKAFYKCTKLEKIVLPANLCKIGKQAFYGCKNLKSITIKTTKLTKKKVGSKAFANMYKKGTIKVPKKKLDAYKKMLKSKGISSKAKFKKL